MAKTVIRDIFSELERRCIEERVQYDESGVQPDRHKINWWATYTSKARLQRFATDALMFIATNADCRARSLTTNQLRFLILLQHFISEDAADFNRSESLRKHQDSFEGILTNGVNSQLVKDAHRSEFSVDGVSFSMQDLPQCPDELLDERRQTIADFQVEFVTSLENFLLSFSSRKALSKGGTKRLVQVVTTQMSQAGLANLDRGSQAARYFVGSNGLDQRTAYNLSTMFTPEGESLKLSILCMKTGFVQYLERDDVLAGGGPNNPKRCKPESYLYQYATISFSVGPQVDNCESIVCTVLDALDEAHIISLDAEQEELIVEDQVP